MAAAALPKRRPMACIYARKGQTAAWIQALPYASPNFAGTLSAGGVAALSGSGNFTVLYTGNGVQAIYLGGSTDQANYYRNSGHVFGDIPGSTTYFVANATNVNFTNIPTAPTATPSTDSSTKLATTAFVQSALAPVSVFIQAGSGAVTRTMQDKARDTRQRQGLRREGDGSTDDHVALNNWLAYISANNKVGFLPAGVYNILSPLNTVVAPSASWLAPSWGIYGEGGYASNHQVHG